MSGLRIKICGITTPADGSLAARLGADMLGLNFYGRSPRSIDVPTALTILEGLPSAVHAIGLFVNLPFRQVKEGLEPLSRIRAFQWYGDVHEPEDVSPYQLIAAFSVRTAEDLRGIDGYLEACRSSGCLPAAVLVDAHAPGQYGGTGQTAPWDLLREYRPSIPLILAGGLTPDNVAEAVRVVRPYGVDVASGVELAPGRKDPDKMCRFIGNAREAAARYN